MHGLARYPLSMKIIANPVSSDEAKPIKLLCPHCAHHGTFDTFSIHDMILQSKYRCGQRRCPNHECLGHVFVILNTQGVLITSYPAIRLPFNRESVPDGVRDTFDEALDCHSSDCHVAAAIMVRRTLEEICQERGATGDNLKKRIADLCTKIMLPQELLDASDELRLLGNDAAHIESESFVTISEEELSVAIEFTKEIIKGVYQYAALLDKFRALKKPTEA